jgi:hypothetical protein
MMGQKHTLLAIALILFAASAGPLQARQSREDIAADFSRRVGSYAGLRSQLENGLVALAVTDDPAAIRKAVRALAERIRVARAAARQGDIFTPAISVELRKALRREMSAGTWKAIMEDKPGEISLQINETYAEGQPVSTVPPNILAALPRLPNDIEYRFVRCQLILIDTRARLIIDRLPDAIPCVPPRAGRPPHAS